MTAYIDEYQAAYGEAPSTFGGYAHDAFAILVDAIARAGSAEPEAIRDAIEATAGLAGTTGVVTMTPGGPPRLRPLGLPHARDQGRRLDPGRVAPRPRARAGARAAFPAPPLAGARSPMPELMQFLLSGVTVGAVYALVALGFTIIYNASDVVNFAQGEFVMLGGMITVFAHMAGLPLPLAALIAIAATAAVGVALNKLAIEPARGAPVVSLIIITIGASIFIRGVAQLVFDKQLHRFPAFSGDTPIQVLGATILPQSLWVLAGAIAVFVGLWVFFTKTLTGRAVLATSNNRLAAQLVGINTNWVMTLSFALSAAIGALAGVLVTPITNTSYDIGIAVALKGFAAAMLGGMGNPIGALVGGILLGLIEALTAGYISSVYKDAAAFVVILVVLFVMPQGIFGRKSTDRV